MPDVINITNAKQIGDYQIFLRFDDESEQVINFKPFLSRSRHPAIREWLDLAKFSTFRLEYGELVWGDYDLCFPIADLYRNELEHFHDLKLCA
ncbi:MAG: DUF2442 domain-containing protein [Methylococcaceae bacterium]